MMEALGLLIFFAIIVAISAIFGLVRGFGKSVIRILTLALAVILTFVTAGPVTSYIAQTVQIDGLTLGEMILEGVRSADMAGDILDAAPLLQEAILAAPAFVMSIVVFVMMFLLLSFVSWILFLILQKPLRKLLFKENGNKEESSVGARAASRLAGLGVGIVTGAVIFGMILTPVLGLLTVLPAKDAMDETLNTMVEQNILSAADAESLRSAYAVTESPLVKIYSAVGVSSAGRNYLNSVSRIEADGQITCLTDEMDALLASVQTVLESGALSKLADAKDQNAVYTLLADKAFMDPLMQNLFRSKLLRSAIPEVMAIAMENVAGGMNVPANKAAVYDHMMDDIALAVQTAPIDYAGVRAYEEANSIVSTFARSARIVRTQTAANLMTEEEYEAEVEKLADLVATISVILNQAISGDNAAFTDSVAGHIVSEVKAQAAENGQTALENFDSASVQSAISNIDAANIDAGEADGDKLLEQLKDQEKFETDAVTVEAIKEAVRESVKSALADETQSEKTASALANVVSDLAGAVSAATDENGSLDAAKLDYGKIASAVTGLQNSPLKDVGTSVLDAVAAGDLGDNALISDVLGAVKESYENGEDISGAIGTAGALISLGSAMNGDGEADPEKMVTSLTELINNLDETTIDLLPSILSDDTIASMGIPVEYVDAAYSVIETLLRELMKLKGAEDYHNEVNSILTLYNLATTGVEQFREEDIAKLADYALQSDAIVNTLVSISSSNPFGIEIEDQTTRNNLAAAIESYYAQSGQTPRERDVYNAVAMLLGLDAEVDLG